METNRRSITEWGQVLGGETTVAAALLDRPLRRSVVIIALRAHVADPRTSAARFPDDQRVKKIVVALRAADARFDKLWDAREVGAVHDTHQTIDHPELGLIDVDCDVLTVDAADLRLVVFTAARVWLQPTPLPCSPHSRFDPSRLDDHVRW